MKVEIPGYGVLDLRHIVLDFNGTLAVDGQVAEETRELIRQAAEQYTIHVLTADTRGTAAQALAGLPLTIHRFPGDQVSREKRRIVEQLGPDWCACLGNGRNDVLMLEAAGLAIAVLEEEGTYGGLLPQADFVVRSISDGIRLVLDTQRLIAGLRG